MMLSENWQELMLPILRRIFDKHKKKLKDFVPVIFNVETSTKALEQHLGIGSLGLMTPWDESGRQVAYEDIHKGFLATYRHKKYSKGLEIERELPEDDQYGEIKKRVKMLVRSVYYTRQFYAVSVFNNAFNDLYPGPDGKALCSTAHPYSPTNSATYCNYGDPDNPGGTLKLNADNVEKIRTAMMEWKDDKGNLLNVMPDTLLVAPKLRKPALVIADSDSEPDTSDNNVNIWHGSLDVIEWPFLAMGNPNAWFLVDRERMKDYLNWFDRRIAKLEQDRENFDTEVGRYKVVNRFSFGWDDPSFVWGAINP